MKTGEWKDGSVEVRGARLTWKLPPVAEIRAYEFELEKARRTYVTLESAKDAFEGGRARYEDASNNVRHLIDESNKAALELIAVMKKADAWFSAPPSSLFEADADSHLMFLNVWLGRVGHPPEVVGNSSRGRSANSRRVPPETVKTARGSSSTGRENPPESDSTKLNGSQRKTADVVRSS